MQCTCICFLVTIPKEVSPAQLSERRRLLGRSSLQECDLRGHVREYSAKAARAVQLNGTTGVTHKNALLERVFHWMLQYVLAKLAVSGLGKVLHQELHGTVVYAIIVFSGRVDISMIAALQVSWILAGTPPPR